MSRPLQADYAAHLYQDRTIRVISLRSGITLTYDLNGRPLEAPFPLTPFGVLSLLSPSDSAIRAQLLARRSA
jgi:hypothetical protein